jgi:cytosine/adenosine deaminase-related metal-dependent hydrolase
MGLANTSNAPEPKPCYSERPVSERLVIRDARPWPSESGSVVSSTVVVEEGRIQDVTQHPVPVHPGDWIIEAKGRLLTPGFVDAHSHVTRKLAVGLSDGGSYPNGHPHLAEPLRGRFERALELEDVAAAARLAFCEAALAGTTTVFEQLRAPACVEGSLDAVGEAARAVGLRAVASYGVSDWDGGGEAGVRECARFAKLAEAGELGPLVRGCLGLANPETLNAVLLGDAAELARTAGLQAHAAETEDQLFDAFQAHGMRGLERLRQLGLLGPKTIASHANQIDRHEGEILAQAGGFCAYMPRTALLAEDAPPRMEAAVDAGAYAVLGTDGLSPSVRGEIPWALALWRRTARPGAQKGFYAVERMAVEAGGRLLGRFFGGEAGLVAAGQVADLVLLDYRPATPTAPSSMCGHLVPGLADAHVAWTIVAGRVVVREGALLTADWAEAAAKALERAERLWQRV